MDESCLGSKFDGRTSTAIIVHRILSRVAFHTRAASFPGQNRASVVYVFRASCLGDPYCSEWRCCSP